MIRLLSVLLLLCLSAAAQAHTRSQASAALEVTGGQVRLTLAIEAREATRLSMLPGLPGDLAGALRLHYLKTTQVLADGRDCPLSVGAPGGGGLMRLEMSAACPAGWSNLTLRYGGFFEVARGHIAIVHARIDGEDRGDAVLTKLSGPLSYDRAPGSAAERQAGFAAFIWLGFTHILEGLDHLCFVLGLLVAAQRLRDAALTLTGFTLGHSATLALSAVDAVRVTPAIVEALIPVTIVCVALEALRRQGLAQDFALWAVAALGGLLTAATIFGAPPVFALAAAALLLGSALSPARARGWRTPFLLAAGFGTVHGLAFAETLKELTGPGVNFLTALLGFNLGVEAGQLLAAGIVWGLLQLWAQRHAPSAAAGLYAIPLVLLFGGAAWLAARLPA
jgi:hypothetical protein